jgi:hypothetical protein
MTPERSAFLTYRELVQRLLRFAQVCWIFVGKTTRRTDLRSMASLATAEPCKSRTSTSQTVLRLRSLLPRDIIASPRRHQQLDSRCSCITNDADRLVCTRCRSCYRPHYALEGLLHDGSAARHLENIRHLELERGLAPPLTCVGRGQPAVGHGRLLGNVA